MTKATQRLYFLKLFKAWVSSIHSYNVLGGSIGLIRPILEYAAPVWQHLLANYQTDQVEAVQKRAINIIHNCTYGMPYSNAPFLAGLISLRARREQLARNFLDSIYTQPRSCLHHPLPPPRDPDLGFGVEVSIDLSYMCLNPDRPGAQPRFKSWERGPNPIQNPW